MKKFSVVTLQILIVSLLLVIPVTLLFASYANHIANIAVTESEKNAQNNLAYVNQTSIRKSNLRIACRFRPIGSCTNLFF